MTDLLEVAVLPLLPVHHVVEDGDHDVPDLRMRHQRHSQEGPHHSWDEVGLVLPQFLPHTEELISHHHSQISMPEKGTRGHVVGLMSGVWLGWRWGKWC